MSSLCDDSATAPSAVPAWFADAHAALPQPHDSDPGEDVPWSMPIVLHIPKPERPARTPLLEAAAKAVVAACLDERAGDPEGIADSEDPEDSATSGNTAFDPATAPDARYSRNLRSWYGERIRKIARRARGTQWERVQSLPGVTVSVAGASARALVPAPVGEEDRLVAKLQIGGTELPHDAAPGAPDETTPIIWVDADLGMTVGKAAAQVGHGSMLLAAVLGEGPAWRWARDGFPLQVREVPRDELPGAPAADVVVVDAGFTEIAPGSATVMVTGGRYSGGGAGAGA